MGAAGYAISLYVVSVVLAWWLGRDSGIERGKDIAAESRRAFEEMREKGEIAIRTDMRLKGAFHGHGQA